MKTTLSSYCLLLIMLVLFFRSNSFAQNCVDTSYKNTYHGLAASLTNTQYITARNDTGILAGNYSHLINNDSALYLIKLTPKGDIFWAKKISTAGNVNKSILNLVEDSDGNIYCQIRDADEKSIDILKFSSIGNFLFHKKITHPAVATVYNIKLYCFANNLYILSKWYLNDGEEDVFISKLDAALNILWAKRYTPYFSPNANCNYATLSGIVEAGDSLMALGRMLPVCFGGVVQDTENNFFAVKLSAANGMQGKSVSYLSPADIGLGYGALLQHHSYHFDISKTITGQMYFYGRTFRLQNNRFVGVYRASIDTNLHVTNGYLFKVDTVLNGVSQIAVDNAGNSNIFYQNDFHQYIAKFDLDNNLLRQKKIVNSFNFKPVRNSFLKPFANKPKYMSIVTTHEMPVVGKRYLQLLQLNNEEKSSECFGTDTNFVKIEPYNFTAFQSPFIEQSKDVAFEIVDMPAVVTNLPVNRVKECDQVSTCNTLKVAGTDTACNLNQSYIYKAKLNGTCYKAVAWQIDTAVVESLLLLNDTSVSIKFKKAFEGFLYAKINSCSLLKDSVFIKVFDHSAGLGLGADAAFCTGTSYLLKAKPGFKNYTWQDGSTDSVFSVTIAGRYYVTATDHCGNIYSDTIVLTQYALPVLQLPGDTSICSNEQLKIDAGAGFVSYQWNNGSKEQVVTANQAGTYKVIVQNTNGCYGSDSTTILNIKPIPTSFLGADKEICDYETIKISPNTNFLSYLWSNGSVADYIEVGKGNYTLKVQAQNKCYGSDTILIKSKNCPIVFFIPNTFTPNADGNNDLLKPLIKGTVKEYEFVVYNRWGEAVFKTNMPLQGWDGNVKGKGQNSGAYIWVCKYASVDGEKFERKGTVLLLR